MKRLHPLRPMPAQLLSVIGLCVGLSACGPETLGAAATAAKFQAANAERAKAQADKLKQDLEAAVKVREAAAAAAEK
jgi:hypothetical protein